LYANVVGSDKQIHQAYKKFLTLFDEIRELLDDMDNFLQTMAEFGKSLKDFEPSEERYILRKARTHALYFEIILEKLRTQFYLGAYFRPVIASHMIQTNPINRITSVERIQELFSAYSNLCEVVVRGGKILIQTIEQKFNEILPPTEEDAVQEVDELIAETLASVEAYVPNLVQACDQLVAYLQTGNPDWKVLFGEFTNGLFWFINVVDSLQKNNVTRVADISLARLQDLLVECERYLKSRDFVSFADCIGFAIKPLLQSYQDELVKGVLH
jgi:hypothetical protein